MRNHDESCVGMRSHQIRAEQSATQKTPQGSGQEKERKKMGLILPSWSSCKMNTPAASIHNTRRARTQLNGYNYLCAPWKGEGMVARAAVVDTDCWHLRKRTNKVPIKTRNEPKSLSCSGPLRTLPSIGSDSCTKNDGNQLTMRNIETDHGYGCRFGI